MAWNKHHEKVSIKVLIILIRKLTPTPHPVCSGATFELVQFPEKEREEKRRMNIHDAAADRRRLVINLPSPPFFFLLFPGNKTEMEWEKLISSDRLNFYVMTWRLMRQEYLFFLTIIGNASEAKLLNEGLHWVRVDSCFFTICSTKVHQSRQS